MAKKRNLMRRKRQLTKTRKGTQTRQAPRTGPAPKAAAEAKDSHRDVWIAVGIVVVVIGLLVAVYQITVRGPAQRRANEWPPAITPAVVPATEQTPTTDPSTQPEEAVHTMSWPNPPAMEIDPDKEYEAIIRTEKGPIRIQLFAQEAPITVNNFVFLARQGFYDGVSFHRVLPGFMAQTGDPTGTGSGGPGYTFQDEFVPTLRHDGEGIVSMANAGPNTNGSQFFITYDATPHLDDAHTVFGRVVEGMEVVRKLTPRDPSKNPFAPRGDRIATIEIIEK